MKHIQTASGYIISVQGGVGGKKISKGGHEFKGDSMFVHLLTFSGHWHLQMIVIESCQQQNSIKTRIHAQENLKKMIKMAFYIQYFILISHQQESLIESLLMWVSKVFKIIDGLLSVYINIPVDTMCI